MHPTFKLCFAFLRVFLFAPHAT